MLSLRARAFRRCGTGVVARPSKKRVLVEEAILKALRNGATRTASAEAVGVHRGTLTTWIERDPAFRSRIEQAEAECELIMTAYVAKAVKEGDIATTRWWLERRRRDDYGKAEKDDPLKGGLHISIGGSIGNPT